MHTTVRPAGMNMDATSVVVTACITMRKACAVKCRAHAAIDEMYRYCAVARDDMVIECEAMMASMNA